LSIQVAQKNGARMAQRIACDTRMSSAERNSCYFAFALASFILQTKTC
jgi:hypothetical protein